MTITKAQLASHLHIQLTGDDLGQAATPPEFHAILACATALEEGPFLVYDLEQDLPPPGLYALGGQLVASWGGEAAGSLGYGCVNRLATAVGPGLEIQVAGSSGSSASTIYIVPAGLEGYLL